ncbi:MAG: MBL fold metallo-hydrolase [Erysipelotrichaceae bacterium]|nr:MBL fold metallo-hydrolase [Erysipelotrichaceae bacterium]
MPLKNHLFRLSCMLASICFLDSFIHRCLLGFFWLLYTLNNIPKKDRKVYLFFLPLVLILSFPLSDSFFETGKVVRIRDSYQLVSFGLKKVMIYSRDENIRPGDTVKISCELQPVDSYDNFERSSFGIWAKGENIIATGRIREYEIARRSISFQCWLYERNDTENRRWINTFLFGKGIKSDSDNRYFLISSGMHISFCVSLIRKLLNRFFYQDKVKRILLILVFLLGWLFGFPYGYIRAFLNLLASILFEDRRQQCGFTVIALCLYKPYGIRSLSFLLSSGIRMISCLTLENSRLTSFLYYLSCQLYLNGTCNITQLALFPLLRGAYGISYLLALIACFLPHVPDLERLIMKLQEMNDSLPVLEVSSELSTALFALTVIMILEYGQIRKKRYVLAVLVIITINMFKSCLVPFHTVTFLDVGQGDGCVITVPFSSRALMIDTGGSPYRDLAIEVLIPYLKRNALRKVSVIISHDDSDHCGALESLVENYEVKEVFTEKKEKIIFGDLVIYDPLYDLKFDNDNDGSLISYFKIGRFGFLFLGDVSANVEEILTERYPLLDADVIKLAHHGSANSTSEKLLSTYLPDYGIISAGLNNSYGHPAKEVLERLNSLKTGVLNTQNEGAIRFYVFRWFMIYRTSKGKTGFVF